MRSPDLPLLDVRDLHKDFILAMGSARTLRAVQNVSFSMQRGEVLALVGESGSGKTTLGRAILRLIEPTAGTINYDGQDITRLGGAALRAFRKRMQIIFQDPFSSLNPYSRVSEALEEPLIIHRLGRTRAERRERVTDLLELVGLSAEHAERFPHEFSGGQRQRIGIARALAVEPEFIVADEPVSALDVSVQAQVINLLEELQERLGLTVLFIAHDLAVVRHFADRVAVMYLGHVLEMAPTRQLFAAPRHPYTEALLSAAPVPDPRLKRSRIVLQGDIPSPLDPPSGCPFRTRCPQAVPACSSAPMTLEPQAPGQVSACIRASELYGRSTRNADVVA